jgi:hypothetical protein
MDDYRICLQEGKGLEQILSEQDNTVFPPYTEERSDKSYPDRYKEVKLALEKIHNSVEKLAMAAELENYINEINSSPENTIKEGIESALIYLNNHGKGHVQRVIEKVTEMLRFFSFGELTPYETFFLLCAIQVHDTGNSFGRKKHENAIGSILDKECSKIIQDKFERTLIERIAMVHCGEIFGEQDTISYLSVVAPMNNMKIRERLLAALLRFGDELSDDCTRVDRYALENDKIPKYSKIFHYYSQSLHTVFINENKNNYELQLELKYDFSLDVAKKKFLRHGKEKYLLDEIYDRTIKMEQERRYCMRYLRPYFYLSCIKVDIKITNEKYAMDARDINYILEEEGYPDDNIFIKKRISGDELVKSFESRNNGDKK